MLRVFISTLLLTGSTFAQFPMAGRVSVSKADADAGHQNLSEWGMQSNGLRCRAVLPSAIEHNETIEAKLECVAVPESLPAEILAVNPCHDMCSNFALKLVNSETGERFIVPAKTRTFGPPGFDDDRTAQYFREGRIFEWPANFPTVRMEPQLPIGDYKASITLEQSGEPNPLWRGTREEWIARGYWWEMLETGERKLRITEESTKTIVLHVPTRLRLIRREHEVPGQKNFGLHVLTYKAEDSEEIVVPTRSGHWMGTSFEGERKYTDADRPRKRKMGDSFRGMHGGAIEPGFDIAQYFQYEGGDIDGEYTVRVFETCDANSRIPGPGCCGYKVLWEKTFDFHASAAEIAAIVPEVIRPHGSPPDTN